MADLPSQPQALHPAIETWKGISSHPKLKEALKKLKPITNTKKYTSRYHDEKRILAIRVFARDCRLYWTFIGHEPMEAPLFHHKDDTFDWHLDRDELYQREGRADPGGVPAFGQMKFETGGDGEINRLSWAHSVGSPPVVYKRVTFG